jgi:hypothetical protein
MAKTSLVDIKSRFETGDMPTGADFVDLIDTLADVEIVLAETTARTAADILKLDASEKGVANGVATLDANSKLATAQIPEITITDTFVVATQEAMLALTCQRGDVAVRSDVSKTFILKGNSPATLTDWQELPTPTAPVLSVNGQTGAVTVGLPTSMTETKTAPAISAGTLTLNCATGNVFAVALNAAITTLTMSSVPVSGTAYGCTVAFTADGTARAITWPGSFKWAGGTAPTLTSTAGKVDIFVFVTWDGGTTWYAHIAGQNM